MLYKTSFTKSRDKTIFVFFNGFGSDYSFWNDLLPYFSKCNYILLSENYFNDPEDHSIKNLRNLFKGKRLIGIGHSLGYHKLCALNEKYDFFKLQKIVSLEGFSCYLGKSEPMKSIRKFYLDFMKNSYSMYPKITLYNFMTMCGAPLKELPEKINQKLLMDDLALLYGGINSPKIPHLVMTSFDDWVIPFNVIEDNFRKLKNVRIIYTVGASHLLGMRLPNYVSREVQEFAR